MEGFSRVAFRRKQQSLDGEDTETNDNTVCFQSKCADEEACVPVKIEPSRALGRSSSCRHIGNSSVQACLSRASSGGSEKSQAGVNGRGSAKRLPSLSKPPVPPKPAHLQSPVTELSSPLAHNQKLQFRPGMEEGGGGGGRGATNRERVRIKHSKVSDLISRFEENSNTGNKRDSSPFKQGSKSANCSPAHRTSHNLTEAAKIEENHSTVELDSASSKPQDAHMPTANGVLVQMEQDKEEEKKACNGENGSIDGTELVNGDMGRTDSRAEDSHSRTDRTGSQSSQENEEGGTNSKQEHAEEASTEQKRSNRCRMLKQLSSPMGSLRLISSPGIINISDPDRWQQSEKEEPQTHTSADLNNEEDSSIQLNEWLCPLYWISDQNT